MKTIVSGILFVLLLVSVFAGAFNVRQVKAQENGIITINADGSITPSTAPILTIDNITYTLTGNIINDSIVVQRNNTVVDGHGYTVQGTGASGSIGIDLSGISNVTIKNMKIDTFIYGVYLVSSSRSNISGNNITYNEYGIRLDSSSSSNSISGNNITINGNGIYLYSSFNNTVSENNFTNNWYDINLNSFSSNNTISDNNITSWGGNGAITLDSSANGNIIYHNNIYAENSDGTDAYSEYNNIFGNNITLDWAETIGVCLAPNNVVAGNNITDCEFGIAMENFNTVKNNNIADCNIGVVSIALRNDGWSIPASARGVVLFGNNITQCDSGIRLDGLLNCTIVGNNIESNLDGIDAFESSWSNTIYHNNFINNTSQATLSSVSKSVGNVWDDGYPSGGNYWSDYLTKYPNAAENDSSGIWNTPYVIDKNNTDHYPLMKVASPFTLSVSISPSSATLDEGQSQLFTSSATGGTSPYSYQWYLNTVPVSGATSATWTFTPSSSGSYQIYLKITDNVGAQATSNTVTVTVNGRPAVSISPTSATVHVGDTISFSSTALGGTSPYSYQWYLNNASISGATNPTWIFMPTSCARAR